MRLPLLAMLLVLALAGCTGAGTGTLTLHVTDKPDAIGDFSALDVIVEKIELTPKGGSAKSYSPATATFDLTKLTNGNVTTLFNGSVDAGNYTRMDIFVTSATGTLASNGTSVDVKPPGGRIFVNTGFEVDSGQTTTFLFDIGVVEQGNGAYILQPNADGSGPRAK
jgi:hypothetical protein